MTAQTQHPFSKFVAILGRGKTKQRHLTLEESREAMEMLLRGEAVPEQIGAFLMLLRLKEEAPSEIAGFAMGTQATFELPDDLPPVDIDWSSYAGKRIQLPWYMLSVLAMVNGGHSVLMHGTEGHTPGRVYTSEVLEYLGLPIAGSLDEAAAQIRENKFAYVPLEVMSPTLRDMINLRPVLGLRSPVHSFSRMLNPLNAKTVMVGIFHRGFMDIHAGAAQMMGMENMGVFRGEGGEVERRPNKPTQVWMTHGDDEPVVETWPQLLPDGHQPPDEEMDLKRLVDVWTGKEEDSYAMASITGTIAVTLRTMGKAGSMAEAEEMAQTIWAARDKGFLPLKA
ncbi:glycosyl transferase family protein [Alisedimentitalea sp. MJ-SS2]|uniref:glycosyl transferase family protein n=1 Tax=Aliisedimentitalea sp. MJ-SS2 TaxID=3049795 RepID=UPI00290E56DA|nr:glycosyl transferase family protein [Alisedimentitalea sp. MJ-SS2]MDU8926203.1 glycosyl transferase family protein [Alisedimentitalea sp. MJ-SS2]